MVETCLFDNGQSTEYAVDRYYRVVGVFRKYAGWQGGKANPRQITPVG